MDDEHDAARDEMYDKLSEEFYPEHKIQAIGEFTAERLRHYYVDHPRVMCPALDALEEGQCLLKAQHHEAALIFFVSAIEMLLKSTLLKPVVHGLVHIEELADVVVESTLGSPGFDRYSKLLQQLFIKLAEMDIKSIRRDGAKDNLLEECSSLQKIRNRIIHQGGRCSSEQAALGLKVAVAVFDEIVNKMLCKLGLTAKEEGEIRLS